MPPAAGTGGVAVEARCAHLQQGDRILVRPGAFRWLSSGHRWNGQPRVWPTRPPGGEPAELIEIERIAVNTGPGTSQRIIVRTSLGVFDASPTTRIGRLHANPAR